MPENSTRLGEQYLQRLIKRCQRGRPSWIGSFERHTLLVFVHVPELNVKYLIDTMEEKYGRYFLNVQNRYSLWESRMVNARKILCLSGNFPYGWHRKMGKSLASLPECWPDDGLFAGRRIHYISVVQDPVDRFLSHFRNARQNPSHPHYAAAQGKGVGEFIDYLDSVHEERTWNIQYEILGGLPKDRFYVLAPHGELSTLVEILERSLGWPPSQKSRASDEFQIREKESLDQGILKEIESRSAQDRELYENVCERFAKRDFFALKESPYS